MTTYWQCSCGRKYARFIAAKNHQDESHHKRLTQRETKKNVSV